MTESLDPRAILERALRADRGIRVILADAKSATTLRHRCNKLREADRRASKDIFPDGDARRGRSEFDCLTLRITEAEPSVLIIDNGMMEIVGIEDIPDE